MEMIWQDWRAQKNIPVLLMGGEPQSIERLQEENAPFLQKPFRLSELEQWVKNILPIHDDETPAAF
jgi:DNA-binding response OmpR family regulator